VVVAKHAVGLSSCAVLCYIAGEGGLHSVEKAVLTTIDNQCKMPSGCTLVWLAKLVVYLKGVNTCFAAIVCERWLRQHEHDAHFEAATDDGHAEC
jgi:hypothetical protein